MRWRTHSVLAAASVVAMLATAVTVLGTTAPAAAAPVGIHGTVTSEYTGALLGGIEVRIYSEPGRVVAGQTTTAPDGTYSFAGLADGTYRVRFLDPGGTYLTEYHPGATTYDGGSDLVLAGTTDATADASLKAPTGIRGTVTDHVTHAPAADVQVRLYTEPGRVVAGQTTTAADGTYAFTTLAPGAYRVRYYDSTGSYLTEYSGGVPFYADASDVVVAGDAMTTADAEIDRASWLYLRVASSYDQRNLSGVQVRLYREPGRVVVAEKTTNQNGQVNFTNLPADTYRIRFIDPTGNHSTEYWEDAATYGAADILTLYGSAGRDVTLDPANPPITLTVDDPGDGDDVSPGDGICDAGGGRCTVRAAVTETNRRLAADTITFLPGLDIVLSTPGADEQANATGDLDITDRLTIVGNGASIDGAGLDRILDVRSTGVTIDGLTVTGGDAGTATGGGIASSAPLSITNSTIRNNTALRGGGIWTTASLYISGSTFADNTATEGGGLYSGSAFVTMSDSTIAGNDAGAGSAWYRSTNTSALATVTSSTIVGPAGSTLLFGKSYAVSGSILFAPGATTCQQKLASSAWNLTGDKSCGASGPTDLPWSYPWLGALGDNGGPTPTVLPAADSPAVDAIPAGTPGLCDGAVPTDQRGLARPANGACDIGAVEGSGPGSTPAAWTVDTPIDAVDAAPGDGACDIGDGTCSLRAAVSEARASTVPATITIGGGVDPTLSITGSGEDLNTTGDLDLAGFVTIEGNGQTIDGVAIDRVLHLPGAYGHLVLHDVTVRGGALATGDGAGIWSAATVEADGVTITANTTATTGKGAGLAVGPSADLVLTNSTVSANAGSSSGAGIWLGEGSDATITSTSITGNQSSNVAGLYATSGTPTVVSLTDSSVDANTGTGVSTFAKARLDATSSTFNDNTGRGVTASEGHLTGVLIEGNDAGGAALDDGSTVVDSVIRANTTPYDGAGLYISGSTTVERSTIAANDAARDGGGVYVKDGPLIVQSSTLSQNDAVAGSEIRVFGYETVAIDSSTIAALPSVVGTAALAAGGYQAQITSAASILTNGDGPVCAQAIGSGDWNVAADSSCMLTGANDLQDANPILGPLVDNGGATPTHMPAANGAGIDRIPPGTVGVCDGTTSTDQRSQPRPAEAGCDVGAVEGAGTAVPSLALVVNSALDRVDLTPGNGICATNQGTCTLRAAVMEANAMPGNHTITIAPGIDPTLTRAGTDDTASTGDLDTRGFITIHGGGATVNVNNVDRGFDVHTGHLVVDRLEVANARLKTVGANGGGFEVRTSLDLRESTVRNTTSTSGTNHGGGIHIAAGGRASVDASTLSQNHPGGIWNDSNVDATVTRSTFSHNTAASIHGFAHVTASTFVTDANAFDGNVTVGGSIMAGGLSWLCTFNGIASTGYNLFSDTSCPTTDPTDVHGIGPALLWALDDNGGPTLTHLPGSNSPAVDAIPADTPGLCDGTIAADQTGAARPSGGACNIGSVEAFGAPYLPLAMIVDTADDGIDATPGDRVCATAMGQCTLRAAITEANVEPLLTGSITIASGVDPTLTITGPDEDANLTGDLDVAGNVILHGNGQHIDATAIERGFHHRAGQVELEDVSITGGSIYAGAAILSDAPLTLTEVTIRDTVITDSNVQFSDYGGAVLSTDSLTMVGGGILDNTAPHGTSGLLSYTGDLHLAGVQVTGNASGNTRCTVAAAISTSLIEDTVVSGNTGIGICTTVYTATIRGSTISDNTGWGLSSNATLTIDRSTIRNDAIYLAGDTTIVNSTIDGGAGLGPTEFLITAREAARVTITGSTIAGTSGAALLSREPVPTPSRIELTATVLAAGPVPACENTTTVYPSHGWNISSDNTCGLTDLGDLQNTDPLLAPIGNNGGPTWTRLPLPGSPLIDRVTAGTLGVCDGTVPTDQRGVSRPQGTACDVGAVEQ